MPIAYFAPGSKASDRIDLLQGNPFARIIPAGRWAVNEVDHPALGRGALAWPEDAPMPLPASLEWRACKQDDLHFGFSDPMPTQEDLARSQVGAVVEFVTTKGRTLSVPLVERCPMAILFDESQIGQPDTEYGQLAFGLHTRMLKEKGVGLNDPDLIRLILLGIRGCYQYITEEVLVALRWLTTDDMDPFLEAVFGAPKKAPTGDNEQSPSSSPASATTPSPQANSSISASG